MSREQVKKRLSQTTGLEPTERELNELAKGIDRTDDNRLSRFIQAMKNHPGIKL